MSDFPSQSTPQAPAPGDPARAESPRPESTRPEVRRGELPRAKRAFDPHGDRPRIGLGRQVLMGLLLFLLTGIITIYWFVTDAPRVQAEAEKALSQLLGGRVT